MEMAAACVHFPQAVMHRSCSQNPASVFTERSFRCKLAYLPDRSALYGTGNRLQRARSMDFQKSRRTIIRRASSLIFDNNDSEDDFTMNWQELARRIRLQEDNNDSEKHAGDQECETSGREVDQLVPESNLPSLGHKSFDLVEPAWVALQPGSPEWIENQARIPANIERTLNNTDLPLSLRMLKKKKRWEKDFKSAGESACCSVKKAFSSMVFIIREVHSYALQLREAILYEDLQWILAKVQQEIHASFVWLFQQIFSQTPTLMIYLMILLANFTVYSMGNNVALASTQAAKSPLQTEIAASIDDRRPSPFRNKLGLISDKMSFIGGGDGGKARPVSGATDGGDGRSNGSSQHHAIITGDMFSAPPLSEFSTTEEQNLSSSESEVSLWNSMVDEAMALQAQMRDDALDAETLYSLVSPIEVKMEPEDPSDYLRTELMYQHSILQDPENTLLLTNFAQFLYLVSHDNDRAEEFFKRAVAVEPKDPEALDRYANFLWMARNDLTAAEEMYVKAIEADDTGNSFYAANYAHFLWNTGGEDTCFPVEDNSSWFT